MMTTLLTVGLGGACGSLTRFVLNNAIIKKSRHQFPVSTMIINTTGAFLLGLVVNLNINPGLLLLLADGFLGAYTTFSTLMFEGFTLFTNRKLLNAAVYIAGTLITGLIAYVLGAAATLLI
jgi:CrcB protein